MLLNTLFVKEANAPHKKNIRARLVSCIWLNLARGIQDANVWLTGHLAEPGSWRAKGPGEPGSRETKMKRVSPQPVSRRTRGCTWEVMAHARSQATKHLLHRSYFCVIQASKQQDHICIEPVLAQPRCRMRARLTWAANQSRPKLLAWWVVPCGFLVCPWFWTIVYHRLRGYLVTLCFEGSLETISL
jgi:hypothetical protein